MRASDKCTRYIKTMISKNKWKLNEKIPSIGQISETLNISEPTTRKVINKLEKQGLLDNCGLCGRFVVRPTNNIKERMLNKIHHIETNLKAYTRLANKGKLIKNWVINTNNGYISVFNIISGEEIVTNIQEIEEVIKSPIELNEILKFDGFEFNKAKEKYEKQQKIIPFARNIYRLKDKLGL